MRKQNRSKKTNSQNPTVAMPILKETAATLPTANDIAKMKSLKMTELPDKNEPIILSEAWYEYTVFLSKFNVCRNTAKSWLKKGWLPYSKVGRLYYINKADIEKMMLRFRRTGLLWVGCILCGDDFSFFAFSSFVG